LSLLQNGDLRFTDQKEEFINIDDLIKAKVKEKFELLDQIEGRI
jgi:hypothetical protein